MGVGGTVLGPRDRHIGLGFDLRKGRDPERNFLAQTQKSVGLKVTIGGD